MKYKKELRELQKELVKAHKEIKDKKEKVLVIFEGRDAAGKTGTIRRFARYLLPRYHRVVALSAPDEVESKQPYFKRYFQQLPKKKEIVLFDRSWYNRAVVEPVMGFCSIDEYNKFMKTVGKTEKKLVDNGYRIVKFWFEITKEEQVKRLKKRKKHKVKRELVSDVDLKSQEYYDFFTRFKNELFKKTEKKDNHSWVIIETDNKKKARLQCIKAFLNIMGRKYTLDESIVQYSNALLEQEENPLF